MFDALLWAVRDALVNNEVFEYDATTCAIMGDGHPAPDCGEVFVAIHDGSARQDMHNAKNDYFNIFITVTMRCSDVPVDRIGDMRLAAKLTRERGFNRRCEEIANFLHMDWGVLQDANQNLQEFNPQAVIVHGFCEPLMYAGMEIPALVGGEWFWADPESADVGLKSELSFVDARRLQTIGEYV